ncbi:Na+/H+ antiporter NhaC [candidate division KSB1 bacterium]|nr:Na+/H+ antiporter NhaC [candidate division KSB1 bacterium]
MEQKKPRTAKLWQALLPVGMMIALLGVQIIVFDSTPHIPLIFGTVFASIMGLHLGYKWKELERGIVNGIVIAIQACLILMVVGTLIGTWIISGIVPTMIYYGLKILSPSIFLFTTCLICSLVSLATGSSWSTAGTIGIALIGVGQGLGIPLPHVAGAIISGSYFGDKMSPLSDTTNLAPAVAGTDMFTHIRHMLYTTGPSLIFSLILYAILGLFYQTSALQAASIQEILTVLDKQFFVHIILLVPPLLIIFMVIFRIPALPALVGGAILGGVFAVIFQHTPVALVMGAAQNGYVSQSGLASVDELLSRGGLESMMSTVALIICALSFGGAMEATAMLEVIANAILKLAKNTGSLVLSTVLTCISMNIIAADQYLSIVIPGRMYKSAFHKRHLQAKNLSRALEDGGTLTSSLIPWNSGGAYMYATLGVYPFAYLPFAFLNLFNPLISIFYGYTGITMHKIKRNNQTLEVKKNENEP